MCKFKNILKSFAHVISVYTYHFFFVTGGHFNFDFFNVINLKQLINYY